MTIIRLALSLKQREQIIDIQQRVKNLEKEVMDLKEKEQRNADFYASLFENKFYTDCVLLVKGVSICAHKCFLVGRSQVFAAMFAHDTAEARMNECVIEDLSVSAVRAMLHFMYTNMCPNVIDDAEEVLKAAEKYLLGDLKKECELQLSKTLSLDNICHHLDLADTYSAAALKDESLAFLRQLNDQQIMDYAEKILPAADKYLLDHLKTKCELQLSETLTLDNVCRRLMLAKKHSMQMLKERSLTFLRQQSMVIFCSVAWADLIRDDPELAAATLIELGIDDSGSSSSQLDSTPPAKRQRLN